MKTSDDQINNIVVVSDPHYGSTQGLLPPNVKMDERGSIAVQNIIQLWLWDCWLDFWRWIYRIIGRELWALVFLGDLVEGRHHHTTQLISPNFSVQEAIALKAMQPLVNKAAKAFFIRGTEAHVGPSAELEEMIAKKLLGDAVGEGPATHWDLWVELGNELLHFAHHISTTRSHAYKSSPLMRLMTASFAAAGEHGFRAPTILVRGHCHDYTEVKRAHCRVVTCPCWQAKTSFAWKFATIEPVVVGGLLIRNSKDGVYIRERIYTEPRPEMIKL